MKRKKPLRSFTVSVRWPGTPASSAATIEGETFFAARAALSVEIHVEPGDVRLDPPRRYAP